MKKTIVVDTDIRYENSFGAINDWEKKKITYNIWVDPIKQVGGYEMYDDDGDYYAEGMLQFDSGELIDYDGVYDLPETIKKQLIKWRFTI